MGRQYFLAAAILLCASSVNVARARELRWASAESREISVDAEDISYDRKTDTVIASLDRRSMIDRQKTTIEGTKGENLAPQVTVEPASQAIQLSQTATLTVKATDDGLPVNPRTKQPEGLAIRWRKYRGPATSLVTFSPAAGPLPDGKGDTKVTFSELGEYVLQAVVDDGSLLTGTYCCWVNTEVRVSVK